MASHYDSVVLADGPVLFLPYSDASGTTATDLSGNSLNGTLSGSFSLGAAGIGDGETSCNFTGGSCAVADAAPLRLGAAAMSVECWLNLTTLGSTGGGESVIWGNANNAYAFSINPSAGISHMGVSFGGNGGGFFVAQPWVLNQWLHLVVATTGQAQHVTVYVDTTVFGTEIVDGTLNSATGVSFFADPGSFGGTLPQGKAAKFAVYNYQLSLAQVQAHFFAATQAGVLAAAGCGLFGGGLLSSPHG